MTRYLTGFAIVCLGLFVIGILTPQVMVWGYGFELHRGRLFACVVAIPVLVAWMTTEGVARLLPPRLFLGRPRATLRLVGYGAVTALAGMCLAAPGLAFAPRGIPDGVILGAAAAIAAIITPCCMRTYAAGRCTYCNHDLRGVRAEHADRCSECGRVNVAWTRSTEACLTNPEAA